MTPQVGQPRAAVAGLILAAALLSIAQLASATAAPPAAVPTAAPPAQSLTLLPPPSHGQPVNIGVGIHIINIASIDEVKEQFEIDGYLIGKWVDSRLPDQAMRSATSSATRSGFLTLRWSTR